MNNNLEIFFQQYFDFSNEESKEIINKLTISNQELVKSRINFYQRQFNLSKKELKTVLMSFPAVLGYGEKYISDKCKFLLKTLKSIIKPYFVKKPTEIIRHNESFHKFAFNRKHIL